LLIAITLDSDDTAHIAWQWIDIGAYEFQTSGTLYDTFTLQATDALVTGTWQTIYSGSAGCWSDTSIDSSTNMKVYRVKAEHKPVN